MTRKRDEILSIQGPEEKLPGDQDEEQPEEKQPKKKKSLFISTSSGSRPPKKERKNAMLTTRDLDADGKLIKKREANNE